MDVLVIFSFVYFLNDKIDDNANRSSSLTQMSLSPIAGRYVSLSPCPVIPACSKGNLELVSPTVIHSGRFTFGLSTVTLNLQEFFLESPFLKQFILVARRRGIFVSNPRHITFPPKSPVSSKKTAFHKLTSSLIEAAIFASTAPSMLTLNYSMLSAC